MKNLRTRLLSLVLAVMMIVSMLPATVLAKETTVPEGKLASYTVDGTTTYTDTYADALTAANAAIAEGKDAAIDLYADATMSRTDIQNGDNEVTLTINLNGNTLSSGNGMFRLGYNATKKITFVVNGGASAEDTTRGSLLYGTGSISQNGLETLGNGCDIVLNNVDFSCGSGSVSGKRAPIYMSTQTNDAVNTCTLNNSTVVALNKASGMYGLYVSKGSAVTTAGTDQIVLNNSAVVSANTVCAIYGTDGAPAEVTLNDGSAIYAAVEAVNKFAELKVPAGYAVSTSTSSDYADASKKTTAVKADAVTYVAEITSLTGNGKYTSLDAALNAVKGTMGTHVIELLDDAVFVGSTVHRRVEIGDLTDNNAETAIDFDLTINMNGYDITCNEGFLRLGTSACADVDLKLTVNGEGGTITWGTVGTTDNPVSSSVVEMYALGAQAYFNDVTVVKGDAICSNTRYFAYIQGAGHQILDLVKVTVIDETTGLYGQVNGVDVAASSITIGDRVTDLILNLEDCEFVSVGNAAPIALAEGANAEITFVDDQTVFNHTSTYAISAALDAENLFFPKGMIKFPPQRRLETTAVEGGYQTIVAEYIPAYIFVYEAENAAVTVGGVEVTYVEGLAELEVAAEENVVVVTPELGFKVTALYVNGEEVADIDEDPTTFTYAFTAEGYGEYEIEALVEEDTSAVEYTITVAETTGGTLTVDPVGTQYAGTMVTVTAEAAEGYKLTAVTVGGEAVELTDGVYTFELTADVEIAATFEAAEIILVAGYTAPGAEEVKYYYNEGYTADSDTNYTTVAKAFAAAVSAWDQTETGTVDVYTNVALTGTSTTPIFNANATGEVSLTLNLHGNTISMTGDEATANGKGPFFIGLMRASGIGDCVVTINGKDADGETNGKIEWGAYRGVIFDQAKSNIAVDITVNDTDIVREKGGDHAENSQALVLNTAGAKATINGGVWDLYEGAKKYVLACAAGNNTTITLTGGVEIKTTEAYAIAGKTANVTVNVDDAVIYTAATGTTTGTGKGIVADASAAAVNLGTSEMTVAAETVVFDGVNVRAITVAPYVAPPAPTTYAVTVTGAANGAVVADKTEAAEGEVVTLTATPAEGYELDAYVVTTAGGTAVEVVDGQFTMPAEAVTVTATFKEIYVAPEAPAGTLGIVGKTLLLKDMIQVRYVFNAKDFGYDQAYAEQNMGVLVWTEAQDEYIPGTEDKKFEGGQIYNVKNSYYSVDSEGIPAKEMGDTTYAMGYLKHENGTYTYSDVIEYSPKMYAMSQLGKDTTAALLKDLLVAMLNYGAAAQVQQGYNVTALVNNELTAEQQAWTYDAAKAVTKLEDTSKATWTADTRMSHVGMTLLTKGAITYRRVIQIDAALMAGAQEYGVLYWNEADYAAAETLTEANATGKNPTLTLYNEAKSQYAADVLGVAAKNLGDTYYICVYVTDGEGVTTYSDLMTYSAHTYCVNQIGKALSATVTQELKDLCKTIIIYSDAAKTYQASIA